MNILRINGKKGAMFYDADEWDEIDAKTDYIDTHGYEPDTGCCVIKSDILTQQEMLSFIRTGRIQG